MEEEKLMEAEEKRKKEIHVEEKEMGWRRRWREDADEMEEEMKEELEKEVEEETDEEMEEKMKGEIDKKMEGIWRKIEKYCTVDGKNLLSSQNNMLLIFSRKKHKKLLNTEY